MVITMSKLNNHNEVTKLYKEIIKNNNKNINLDTIITDSIDINIVNKVIKELSKEYEIESINPIIIKKI